MAKKSKSSGPSWGVNPISPASAAMFGSHRLDPASPRVEMSVNGAPASGYSGPVAFLVLFSGYDIGKPGSAQVTINGRHIPQDEWMSTIVKTGDDIKILPR